MAANGANIGDVLKFDGAIWSGQSLNFESTPWSLNNDDLSYEDGNVGIGINPSSALHVKGENSNPLIIDGGNNMYISLRENGLERGYIGSYQSQINTNNEDFEIGTYNGTGGNLHLTTGSNSPRITVTADGKVGINNLVPEADLHVAGDTFVGPRGTQGVANAKLDINSTASGNSSDPLRVRKNGDIKFYVDSNGGASVGSWDTPPANGLKVAGNTLLDGETTFTGDAYHSGDVKQDFGNHGLVKYLLLLNCSNHSSQIIRSYDGLDIGSVSMTNGSASGLCIINFPIDISNAFFQATPVSGNISLGIGIHCDVNSSNNNNLNCKRFDTDDLQGNNGKIMLNIY